MNTTELIRNLGYLGLFAIVFAETGLLIGLFLPGDTLLISAGVLAARGQLHIVLVLLIMIAGAVIGDATGYWIGRQAGQRLFQRDDSFWFRREHLEKARRFYARHGGKTIIAARFVTALRTFAPLVAGAAEMRYKHFAFYNVIGAAGWVCSITLLGYAFGNVATKFDHWIFIGAVALLPFPLIVALSQSFRLRRARARFHARCAEEREAREARDREESRAPSA